VQFVIDNSKAAPGSPTARRQWRVKRRYIEDGRRRAVVAVGGSQLSSLPPITDRRSAGCRMTVGKMAACAERATGINRQRRGYAR
jgi:hypothetical protein